MHSYELDGMLPWSAKVRGKTERIADLEEISRNQTSDIFDLKNDVRGMQIDLDYTKQKVEGMGETVSKKEFDSRWKDLEREQRAQEQLLVKVKPRIQRAEQAARVMIDQLQADHNEMKDQLTVVSGASDHQMESIIWLKDAVRALRDNQPLPPYPHEHNKKGDVVLYKPPENRVVPYESEQVLHIPPENRVVPYRKGHRRVLYKYPPEKEQE